MRRETVLMQNFLVTGGAGFIGSHLCERLLREGIHVICLDNFDSYYDPSIKIKNVEGLAEEISRTSLNSSQAIFEIVNISRRFSTKIRVDLVVHLAARAGVRPSIADPLLYQDVNIRGTIVLLEACKEFGIKDFIFASSSSVYGENQKVPFSEEDLNIQPISPYGATKEGWGTPLLFLSSPLWDEYRLPPDLHSLWSRGRGRRWRSINSPGWSTRVERIPMYGDGSSSRDYTYIDDLIEGILGVLHRHKGFEIYNLGESQTTSLKELIRVD